MAKVVQHSNNDGFSGRGQLSLIEHALCPLDTSRALRQKEHRSEYFYMDKNRHQRRAVAQVVAPLGLSPNDEFFLWGLLGITLKQREPSSDLYATPHFCLRQMGCLAGDSKGGKNYRTFRQAIDRLSAVRYRNDRFYDPIRKEHRDVSFGFFSYSLPLGKDSSRAWRIVWDALFFEICQASGGHLGFDLAQYRELDYANRRLFLLLKKVFWRRTESPEFDLEHLAVAVIGYSDKLPTRTLKAKVERCAKELLARGIIALPDDWEYRWFKKQGKGKYTIRFHRGPYFEKGHQVRQESLIESASEVEPLRAIGFDDKAIHRIMEKFNTGLIQVWADVTLAAIEHRGKGFFRRSPQAFFMDNIRHATDGHRTPPDWFHQFRKVNTQEDAERDRKERRSSNTGSDRETFERVVSEMFDQFRSEGQSETEARQSAERAARSHQQAASKKRASGASSLAELLKNQS